MLYFVHWVKISGAIHRKFFKENKFTLQYMVPTLHYTRHKYFFCSNERRNNQKVILTPGCLVILSSSERRNRDSTKYHKCIYDRKYTKTPWNFTFYDKMMISKYLQSQPPLHVHSHPIRCCDCLDPGEWLAEVDYANKPFL